MTHHREERRAAANAERQGFEYYLPEIYTERDRRTLMFPGYIFFCLRSGWRSLASTRGVARLITFGEKPSVVRQSEIDELRKMEDALGVVRLTPRLTDGQVVRVGDDGENFSGFTGIVKGTPQRGRVGVLLELLGRQVVIGFDVSMLEAL